jgi:hypothetical protein
MVTNKTVNTKNEYFFHLLLPRFNLIYLLAGNHFKTSTA